MRTGHTPHTMLQQSGWHVTGRPRTVHVLERKIERVNVNLSGETARTCSNTVQKVQLNLHSRELRGENKLSAAQVCKWLICRGTRVWHDCHPNSYKILFDTVEKAYTPRKDIVQASKLIFKLSVGFFILFDIA